MNIITRKGAESGFTLIELMIVIVILAILATLAIPSFTDFIEKNRVKNAAEDIYALLNQAKSEAVMRDTDLFVTINAGAWCLGFADAANCNCTLTDPGAENACAVDFAGAVSLRVVDGGDFEQVTITDDSFGGSTTFDSIRGVTQGNALEALIVQSGDWVLSVRVDEGGRARVCKPADTDGAKGVIGFPDC